MRYKWCLGALCIVGGSLLAWGQKQKGAGTQTEISPTLYPYLGAPAFTGGTIPKSLFDSLLRKGIRVKDSSGSMYAVDGFMFGYGERNLYEDSVGNLMYLTDFIYEYCPGDTISLALSRNIFYKTKPGDTAYFDNIKATFRGKQLVTKKGMKFILTP